jgi:hypothetical protein
MSALDASAAERVLDVKELAEHLAVLLARAGDAADLGRAACACKALRAACSSEGAWQLACPAHLPTAAAAHASLEGEAARSFSWRRHFTERMHGGPPPTTDDEQRTVRTSLADSTLLLVNVWHRGRLVFSAALSPDAEEMLEDECYSDSDDYEYDTEWKQEFAIANEASDETNYGRCPAFVDAGRLRASAWLQRRDGRLERVMCRAASQLDTVTVGSVAWAGGGRFFIFQDGAKPGMSVSLHLAGWLVEDKTGYRWWGDQQPGPRPPQGDKRRLTRLRVRWEPAAGV